MTYKPSSVLAVIYLGLSLPINSSDIGDKRRTTLILSRLAPNGVYIARYVATAAGVSYTSFPPLPL